MGQHVGAFLRGHALIALAEGLAGDEHEIDLVGPGIDGAAHALFIQGQRDVAGRFRAVQSCKYRGRVRHFRHGLRADKAAGFHPFHTGCFQAGNEFQFLVDRQIAGIVLQPVARADFHNIDTSCHEAYVMCIEGK